ncbi:hypothetical protein PIB30_061739 [Stylosanthes scabra]|uniref:Uncharacterized protein n=1 Tax=Stylosanthes scabra TaxID=79078 RepID=A0ABU6QLM8_9FABA|nr:hypothetical protein [Stylosanthes scabra]
MTLVELQNTILQKLGVAGSKRVSKLFNKALFAVVSEHVKYGSFVVQSDADLEVIFYCWRDFSEVRMTELYAKLEDIIASSGGSNPNPTSVHIGDSSSSAPVALVVPVIPPSVAFSSFAADLHREDDDVCDLGDNRTFGELVTIVAKSPHNPLRGVQINEPEGIEEALCDDREDEEPKFVGGDINDNHQSIPTERGGPLSSGPHQYSAHFSAMDLEAMEPT